LTSVRTGSRVTSAMAPRKARVRRSVAQASTAVTPSRAARNPVLLIIQPPSGWT
jgi:hypothetical protein